MKLVVADPFNDNHIEMLSNFNKEKNISLETLNYLENIKKTMSKDKYNEEKSTSININETLLNIQNEKIINLCFFTGTKDNKLVQLDIENLKNGNNEKNREFLTAATNYALASLEAETMTIFSNELDSKMLEANGFISLGENNGINTYVKDREKAEEIGITKK